MEIVIRGIIIYFVLFILFRISGKRAINESSPFGLVLILLVSSSVADSLKNEDRSIVAGILLASTLIGIHLIMSILKRKNHFMRRLIEDVPTVLVRNGELYEQSMKQAKISIEDILAAGRQHEVTKIADVKYGILEVDGSISIIKLEKK